MIVLIPLVALLLIAAIIIHAIVGRRLARQFRMRWMAERRFIVFVHSDSPVWKEHLNERLFPLINDATVFLNWSHRKQWKLKTQLEAQMLWHWGGPREFNPMAI